MRARSVTTWSRQGWAFFEDGAASPHAMIASRDSRTIGSPVKSARVLRLLRMAPTAGLSTARPAMRGAYSRQEALRRVHCTCSALTT